MVPDVVGNFDKPFDRLVTVMLLPVVEAIGKKRANFAIVDAIHFPVHKVGKDARQDVALDVIATARSERLVKHLAK